MKKSDDLLLLQGDAIPHLKVVLHNEGSDTDFHRKQQVYTLLMMQLCFFMGDLNQAKEMAERNLKFRDEDFPYFLAATIYPFWRSLIYFSLVRQGQTKYRWKAFAQMRIIEGFVRAGISNCHYMLIILKAEKAAMEFLGSSGPRKISKLTTLLTVAVKGEQTKEEMSIEIRHMYDDAIKSAAKSGFMRGRALASERAGMLALETGGVVMSMRGWDKHYIKEARDLYAEWGASVKVGQPEEQYAHHFGSDETSTTSRFSSHIKGKLRFEASAIHHATDCFQLSSGESDDDCKAYVHLTPRPPGALQERLPPTCFLVLHFASAQDSTLSKSSSSFALQSSFSLCSPRQRQPSI
jgi:hypothetical protein